MRDRVLSDSDRSDFEFDDYHTDAEGDPAATIACNTDTQRVVDLVQQQRTSLVKRIRRMRFCLADAEDIVQETCIRLLRVRNLWRGEREVRAFMFKVATNLALDELRRRKTRFHDQHQSFEAVEVVCHAPLPDERLDELRAAQVIARAMRRMSPRCRQVFSMHIDSDMSYRSIATRLGVSTKTIERDFDAARELCLHKCHVDRRSRG